MAAAAENGVSKELQLSMTVSSMFPGFRFSPTDEELISFYLKKKLDGYEKSVEIIAEVEIYKYEPWDLPGQCCFFQWSLILRALGENPTSILLCSLAAISIVLDSCFPIWLGFFWCLIRGCFSFFFLHVISQVYNSIR